MTADIYTTYRHVGEHTTKTEDGKILWMDSCGCQHDAISKNFPELAKYIKWHLCSSDGPMHYPGNALYLAGDKDCWGLRKGETRQLRNGKTGVLAWKLEATQDLPKYVHANEKPQETATLRYVPWSRVGEGKEREFDKARSAAIWPDATDDDLMADDLKDKLEARLPALMDEFRHDMEELGFTF
jgi:hypothetical protein